MANSISWKKIFNDYKILEHDFNKTPFIITGEMIKIACQDFKKTAEKEVRILCKQDSIKDLPDIMRENGLFLLPVNNGTYNIIKGNGYMEIPDINSEAEIYNSKLGFELQSSKIGNSEMQHLDFAYASSLIRTFMEDPTLVLTIRGRKYTPEFTFNVGSNKITAKSVQTEVDAGYEGKEKIVLIEAKNSKTKDTIIRQLYYPFRKWTIETGKDVDLLFFEKRGNIFYIWQYDFTDIYDYNSIRLIKSKKYIIK